MKERDDLRFYVLSKIFQSYQDDGGDNEWLFPMGPVNV